MNLISDMKILHAKKFKEGNIRQATFLKSFKKEIFELVNLGYTPSEIKGYLEEKLDVSINMNAFYAWLNYTKSELPNSHNKTTTKIANVDYVSEILDEHASKPKNTLDVLSSTDFD